VRLWREKLAALTDATGDSVFSESELRFFDLYFGGDRIRVEKIGSEYSVTNGRHRLWLAQQEGVKALPVFLIERTNSPEVAPKTTKEVSTMSDMELRDIEIEAKEQQEQAEGLKYEIEQHKERVEKLERLIQEIRASAQELRSEELTHAEIAAQRAKAETERRLSEAREQKDKLLQENQRLTEKIFEAQEKRKEALEKVQVLMMLSPPDEIGAHIQTVYDSLWLDWNRLVSTYAELAEIRKKIESLDA
jgi:DNA repair exonuclease SbcCD ATPase subunit